MTHVWGTILSQRVLNQWWFCKRHLKEQFIISFLRIFGHFSVIKIEQMPQFLYSYHFESPWLNGWFYCRYAGDDCAIFPFCTNSANSEPILKTFEPLNIFVCTFEWFKNYKKRLKIDRIMERCRKGQNHLHTQISHSVLFFLKTAALCSIFWSLKSGEILV